MPGSLAPAFLEISYHSAFGPHKMQIGITGIENIGELPVNLTATAWDASSRNIDEMVSELVTDIVPRFPAAAEFDNWSAFSQPLPSDIPLFVGARAISSIGTAATPGWSQATQESVNMRDAGGNAFKLQLMDFATGDDWAKYTNAAAIGLSEIFGDLSAMTNAWMSRMNLRPSSFISRTATLNEKLRRSYRLA